MNIQLQHHLKKQLKPDRVIAIYGATASGKSSLAIEIAKAYNGEIIAVDSRTVYKDACIGTAAPDLEEQENIPHHGLGMIGPDGELDIVQFQQFTYKCIRDIHARGKLPILVGGTNLYMDACVEGYLPAAFDWDDTQEAQLSNMTLEEQQKLLQKLDEATHQSVDLNNPRHFINKLKYCIATNQKYSKWLSSKKAPTWFHTIALGMQWPRELLYKRIDERVDIMFDQGLISETKMLLESYDANHVLFTSIGYKQVKAFLEGEYDEVICKDLVKRDTRRFAKRQLTWLRKKELFWVNGV
jgi:tRNA dimethylallyltransferase